MSSPPPRNARSSNSRGRKLRITLAVSIGVLLVVACLPLLRSLAVHVLARSARGAVADGRFAEAYALVEPWLRARPESAEAHALKARAALGLGRLTEAIEATERARSFGHPAPDLDRLSGLILVQAGRPTEAEPILRRARGEGREPDPEVDRILARIYLETYRLGGAAGVIERWIRDAPDDPTPYLWRTEITQRTDADPASLIRDYTEALRLDPGLDGARLGLADALRADHRYAEAESSYASYLDRQPDDPAGHLGAGLNAKERGDQEAALRHLDRALALAPDDIRVLLERARFDLYRGEAQAALDRLDRAIGIDPHDPELHHARHLALLRLGRRDEAKAEQDAADRLRRDLEHMAEIHAGLLKAPNDVERQREAARWLIEHGHGEEGVRWAEQVLRTQPGDPAMSRLLTDYYEGQGNPKLADQYRIVARADEGRSPTAEEVPPAPDREEPR